MIRTGKTSDFGNKIAQNYINDKMFLKNKHWHCSKHIDILVSTRDVQMSTFYYPFTKKRRTVLSAWTDVYIW